MTSDVLSLPVVTESEAPLRAFEYEIAADSPRPAWQFWRPKGSVYAVMFARSQQQAIDRLATAKLDYIDVRPISGVERIIRGVLFHPHVPVELVTEFIANFSTMTATGEVSAREACESLAEACSHSYLRVVIATIGKITGGSGNLWEALAFFPDVFNEYIVAVVKSGESTDLSPVLDELEQELRSKDEIYQLEKQHRGELRQIGAAVLVMMAAFFIWFLPAMMPSADSGPLWLAPLVWISALVRNVFADILVLVLVVIGRIGYLAYLLHPRGRYWHDQLIVTGSGELAKIRLLWAQGEVFRGFARLYDISGNAYDAWTKAAPTANNAFIEERFLEVRDRTNRSVALGQALKDLRFVDPRAIQMVAAAERSGPSVLVRRMRQIAADFRKEAKRRMMQRVERFAVHANYAFGLAIIIISFFSLALFSTAITHPPQ